MSHLVWQLLFTKKLGLQMKSSFLRPGETSCGAADDQWAFKSNGLSWAHIGCFMSVPTRTRWRGQGGCFCWSSQWGAWEPRK